jgi:hypothetical protein
MPFNPRPLPPDLRKLCEKVSAPPRLIAHLTLVHDAAAEIVARVRHCFPQLVCDCDAVLFGAATHDLGKVLHLDELTGPGKRHEADGPRLLEQNGVAPELARFARTHGAWSQERLPLEDLLVSLADTAWKGQRLDDLESQVIDRIAEEIGAERWEVFGQLDGLLQEVAGRSDARLAWQQRSG